MFPRFCFGVFSCFASTSTLMCAFTGTVASICTYKSGSMLTFVSASLFTSVSAFMSTLAVMFMIISTFVSITSLAGMFISISGASLMPAFCFHVFCRACIRNQVRSSASATYAPAAELEAH